MPVIPPKNSHVADPDDPLDACPKFSEIPIGTPLLEELEAVARKEGYDCNAIMVFMLKWAISEYREQEAAGQAPFPK